MSGQNPLLYQEKEKSVPPLVYALISNALQVYGVLVLGWHFFPILYMWWWEEFVRTVFGALSLRRWRTVLLQHQPESEVMEGERAARGRFFLLFVYFIFLVVLAGFMFAPEESIIPNVVTLVFRNQIFNANLLLFIAFQGWYYWRETQGNVQIDTLKSLQITMDTRSMIIHSGLLMGALLSFLLPKYGFSGAEHAFMYGFMAVKTGVELWSVWRGSKQEKA